MSVIKRMEKTNAFLMYKDADELSNFDVERMYGYTLPCVFKDGWDFPDSKQCYARVSFDHDSAIADIKQALLKTCELVYFGKNDLIPLLQNALIRNIYIDIKDMPDYCNTDSFKEIINLFIEKNTMIYLSENDHPIYRTMRTTKNQFIECLEDILGSVKIQSLLDTIENKMNRWCSYTNENHKGNLYYFMTYKAASLAEKLFVSIYKESIVIPILCKFVQHLKSEGFVTSEINMYEKRRDGVYNIDYALSLFMSHRWSLLAHTEKEQLENEENMSNYDKQMIVNLYENFRVVNEVIQVIQDILDEDSSYKEYEAQLSAALPSPKVKGSAKLPYNVKSQKKLILARLKKFLHENEIDEDIAEYIKARVNLYISIILDHNRVTPIKSKKSMVSRALIGAAGLATSIFTLKTLRDSVFNNNEEMGTSRSSSIYYCENPMDHIK
ncbi:hypothetical protein NEAUS04_2550 [Nematocida ausubeli]|uniref:Uncharacterized protein n=1 Tax=Nematocida ausubeli (strain ATCC PRA-371 / ERTm2) TaxID=1913371 RepID=A0A086J0H0_NEMA1|nr:uncharacterized protein NESG_01616 [Nematocida ausubeli]KAI5165586.1 hypothetical protein NEAUS04_2493 [Nematocida ausubeli]KAI5166124.1 hypothetical protein NEAUS04_2550 [Nematocida ausubeli]KFG25638.1 hypothetical protein NESG_01616 [Nematocida ausubeli]